MPLVLDATNLILGRLASETAQILLGKITSVEGKDLEGKNVKREVKENDMIYIINADKAVLTGDPKTTTKRYVQRMHIKTLTNPRKGPFMPRQPEAIVRRAVRGMIPWKKASGKEMYRRLRIYVGTPEIAKPTEAVRFQHISAEDLYTKRITVGELARRISSYNQREKYVK